MAKRKTSFWNELYDVLIRLLLAGALFLTGYVFLRTQSFVWASISFTSVVGILFAIRFVFFFQQRERLKQADK